MKLWLSKEKLRNQAEALADNPKKAAWLLGGLSFVESSFFPIPPDVVLMPLAALRPKKAWWFAAVTTIGSVLGAFLGYAIGFLLYDTIGVHIIESLHLQDDMVKVGQLFTDHAGLAMFVSAFTPIPYKVFTIAAGVFSINFLIFTMASIIGRGMRFFIEAALMRKFGARLVDTVYKYFNLATLVIIIAAVIYFLLK